MNDIEYIRYYQDINYIYDELKYLNIFIDRNIEEEYKLLNNYSGPIWTIIVSREHINKDFFKKIRQLDINNIVILDNSICCIYNDLSSNIMKKIWTKPEYEDLYKNF